MTLEAGDLIIHRRTGRWARVKETDHGWLPIVRIKWVSACLPEERPSYDNGDWFYSSDFRELSPLEKLASEAK